MALPQLTHPHTGLDQFILGQFTAESYVTDRRDREFEIGSTSVDVVPVKGTIIN